MSDVISEDSIMNIVRSDNVKIIIVGALVDLSMKNGWVKKNEFIPIDFTQARPIMDMVDRYGKDRFRFDSKLIDANNNVREITLRGNIETTDNSGERSRGDLVIPGITEVEAEIDGLGLTAFNVRLVTHVTIGCQVIGDNYANGDFLKKNVTDYSPEDRYR